MPVNEVKIQEWVSVGGGMMVHCEALNFDDPMHVYNQIKAQGGVPEEFGYNHPLTMEFEHKTRDELIEELVTLRREITAMHRSGLF